MRRTTLVLKLRVQGLGKLLAHQTALHAPTTMQMPHNLLLAAASLSAIIGHRIHGDTGLRTNAIPVQSPCRSRKESSKTERALADWVRKPAAKQRKLTPFTLKHDDDDDDDDDDANERWRQ